MARIRTIKPELPQSETIGRLSRDARLLFILLFTVVDDAGRTRAASRLLASLLYPYDDDAPDLISGWLDELAAQRHIRRYEIDGAQYLEILKWLEHQKIDRPSPSRLPEFRDVDEPPREASRGLAADLGPSTLDHGPHTAADADAPASACDFFEEFWKGYPQRDGDNPKQPAKKKFDALVKSGVDPPLLIAGAKRYADEMRAKGHTGTQYVAHALKWLEQERWSDAAAVSFVRENGLRNSSASGFVPTPEQWDAAARLFAMSASKWSMQYGPEPGMRGCRCPPEILRRNGIDPATGLKLKEPA